MTRLIAPVILCACCSIACSTTSTQKQPEQTPKEPPSRYSRNASPTMRTMDNTPASWDRNTDRPMQEDSLNIEAYRDYRARQEAARKAEEKKVIEGGQLKDCRMKDGRLVCPKKSPTSQSLAPQITQ